MTATYPVHWKIATFSYHGCFRVLCVLMACYTLLMPLGLYCYLNLREPSSLVTSVLGKEYS
jgi:hypothetical protein